MKLLVDKAYLMVTTRCNVNCRYCIVKKTDEDMDPATIPKAIDFVVDTYGDDKKVAIYGGEPLMRYALVEAVIKHVEEARARTDKTVSTYIYTNGQLLDDRRIDYFAEKDLRVVFSFDGCQRLLDPSKRTAEFERSFEIRLRHARQLLDRVGPVGVCAATVLLPDEVDMLIPLFDLMVREIGVTVVKVLPGLVRYHWTEEQVARLKEGLDDLFRRIVAQAQKGRFLFLDSVNDALLRTNVTYPSEVERLSVIEIYPGGNFGLSPCEFEGPDGLENVNEIPHFLLGSIFDADATVVAAKARLIDLPKHSGLTMLSIWSERVAQWLVDESENSPLLARYVERARELVFA